MDQIYKNIEQYNPNKIRKILIVFDDFADMVNNTQYNPVIIGLFIRDRQRNISLVFLTQFCFAVSKILD